MMRERVNANDTNIWENMINKHIAYCESQTHPISSLASAEKDDNPTIHHIV